MICLKCGKQLPDSAAFCGFCGTKISPSQSAAGQAAQTVGSKPEQGELAPRKPGEPPKAAAGPAKKHGPARLVVAAVIVLAIIGTAAMLLRHPGASNGAEAEAQLLGYVDAAEEAVRDFAEKYSEAESDFGKRKELAVSCAEELSALQAKAEAVDAKDGKLRDAAKEYFETKCAACDGYRETITFIDQFLSFMDNHADAIPAIDKYSGIPDYRKALAQWWKDAKKAYETIECPGAQDMWKRYGEVFDLCEKALRRIGIAAEYNDWLRFSSAIDMLDRYTTYTDNWFSKIVDEYADGVFEHAMDQNEVAGSIAKDMHAYSELKPGDREAYTIDSRRNKINIRFDAVDVVYPALFNSYDAFATVRTGCISGRKDIVIEAEIPGFTQKYRESFTLTSASRTVNIKPPALTEEIRLSSEKDAQIQISVYEKDGTTLIKSKSFPIKIKSRNDFELRNDSYGTFTTDNFLCYLTPDAEAVTRLRRKAIDEIRNLTNGNMELFPGYQKVLKSNYLTTYAQAAGIMRAMYSDMNIKYNMGTFSYSDRHQHVLFPEEVIAQQSGVCIETALTVASALQGAGMHVYLVFPPGHAQVALEAWGYGAENDEGVGRYFLIETTALEEKNNNDQVFVDGLIRLSNGQKTDLPIALYSQDEWKQYIYQSNAKILDCDDYNLLGLRAFTN